MDINQVIQNLAAKDSSGNPDSKANELNAKLKETLKNDPKSFEKLVAELEAKANEKLSEDAIPDLNGETPDKEFLKQVRNSADLKNLKLENEIDTISTKKSGLRILEADTNQTNGVTILKDQNAIDEVLKKDSALDRRLEHAGRNSLDSNLSLDEIENIQKVLKSKGDGKIQSNEAKVLNENMIQNKKNVFIKDELPTENSKQPIIDDKQMKKIVTQNSEDFLDLNTDSKVKELRAQNAKVNFSNSLKSANYKNTENNIISLKNNNEIVNEASSSKSKVFNEAPLTSATIGLTNEIAPKVSETNKTATFQIESLDTSNREAIINKVTDYIVQSKINNSPKLEMSFSHHELGQIELLVEKGIGDQVNVMISPKSTEGMKFFTQHQGAILNNLASSGISLGEFKLDGQAAGQNNQGFDQGSSNQQFAQNNNGSQREQDSKRRQELWQHYQNREAA